MRVWPSVASPLFLNVFFQQYIRWGDTIPYEAEAGDEILEPSIDFAQDEGSNRWLKRDGVILGAVVCTR